MPNQSASLAALVRRLGSINPPPSGHSLGHSAASPTRPKGLLTEWDDLGTGQATLPHNSPIHLRHSLLSRPAGFARDPALLAWHEVLPADSPAAVGMYAPTQPHGLLEWIDYFESVAPSGEHAMAPELRHKPAPDQLLNLPPIWYPAPNDASAEQIRVLRELLQRTDIDGRTKDKIRAYIEDYEKDQDRLLAPGEGMDNDRRFYQWHEEISPEDWQERKKQEEQRWNDRVFDRG